MSKCCIRLGEFKKILSFPLSLVLLKIIIFAIEIYYPEEIKNHILESTSIGLSNIAIIIIPHIKFFSIRNDKKKTNCECSKKICLHYFILFILFVLKSYFIYFHYLNKIFNNYSIFYFKLLNAGELLQSIELIFITIMAKFMLKYKYFNHHYLSMAFFLWCCS